MEILRPNERVSGNALERDERFTLTNERPCGAPLFRRETPEIILTKQGRPNSSELSHRRPGRRHKLASR